MLFKSGCATRGCIFCICIADTRHLAMRAADAVTATDPGLGRLPVAAACFPLLQLRRSLPGGSQKLAQITSQGATFDKPRFAGLIRRARRSLRGAEEGHGRSLSLPSWRSLRTLHGPSASGARLARTIKQLVLWAPLRALHITRALLALCASASPAALYVSVRCRSEQGQSARNVADRGDPANSPGPSGCKQQQGLFAGTPVTSMTHSDHESLSADQRDIGQDQEATQAGEAQV